jgi:ADP-ribose pyrophosphatase
VDARELPDPPPFEPFGVLESARLYDSHWCGLRRDLVRLADGSPQEYHVFEIPDAVVVVPFLDDGALVLIGQYRYPHGRTHWEVPAGRIGAGETAEQAARRELREESGCVAGRLIELPGFYPVNGISPHYVRSFAALDCRQEIALDLDRSERIVARRFERAEVERLLRAGRIQDAFTALALFYALQTGAS